MIHGHVLDMLIKIIDVLDFVDTQFMRTVEVKSWMMIDFTICNQTAG
jgi:hypothetical protein